VPIAQQQDALEARGLLFGARQEGLGGGDEVIDLVGLDPSGVHTGMHARLLVARKGHVVDCRGLVHIDSPIQVRASPSRIPMIVPTTRPPTRGINVAMKKLKKKPAVPASSKKPAHLGNTPARRVAIAVKSNPRVSAIPSRKPVRLFSKGKSNDE